MPPLGTFLPVIIVIAMFYFLVLRPARTRQAQQRALNARLAPGLDVMTTSGIFGLIVSIADDQVSLEVAPGVRIRVMSAAIAKIVDSTPADESSDTASGGASRSELAEG